MDKITRNWITVPGLICAREQSIGPEDAKQAIEAMGLHCNICLEDVFAFYGDANITIVFINRLDPQQAVLLMPEEEFRKEMSK